MVEALRPSCSRQEAASVIGPCWKHSSEGSGTTLLIPAFHFSEGGLGLLQRRMKGLAISALTAAVLSPSPCPAPPFSDQTPGSEAQKQGGGGLFLLARLTAATH